MATSTPAPTTPAPRTSSTEIARPMRPKRRIVARAFASATRPIRAVAKAATFFLEVFPMLPSQPVDWVTTPPVMEKVRYPTRAGQAEGDLYRPSAGGPHPGIVVCLGVVPFGVNHPQVPRLGNALARAGFASLLYWSPAMRDFRLDPDDIEDIALAYRWLLGQPDVDPARSGLFGTCVGGAFALMAAASSLIRERVGFVGAYAPYSSMWTFARDIASATRSCAADGDGCGDEREPWQVDPLTRKVFVHSVTASLEPDEAERLRSAFATDESDPLSYDDGQGLSADGRAVFALLTRGTRTRQRGRFIACLPSCKSASPRSHRSSTYRTSMPRSLSCYTIVAIR